jgi:hypothetical protein
MGSTNLCAVCRQGARREDPLLDEPFYAGILVHLSCLNTEAGTRWRVAQALQDPRYGRYLQLITAGYQVTCTTCGSEENFLYPKLIGHSPAWELCCMLYHQISAGIDPYVDPELTNTLSELYDDFVRGINAERIERQIEHLSEKHGERFAAVQCSCGGTFSIRAGPRCRRCGSVQCSCGGTFSIRARPRCRRCGSVQCSCGGTFSIRARPRCRRCGSELLDSYFHYNDGRPEGADSRADFP